jgi:hypothetical protein
MGGHGIARPGMMLGSITGASFHLRQFAARLTYLLTHVFIQRVLSGTCRENQGKPGKVQKELATEWYDWLRAKPSANIQLSDMVTFSMGNAANLNFDALNDPQFLFDHIT